MLSKTHIIHVCFLGLCIGKLYREIPEAEAVNGTFAFGNGKEGFSVIALNSCHKVILAVKENCSRIENSIYSQSFHKIGICFGVKVIFPDYGCVVCGKHRVFIAVINSVIALGNTVLSGNESLIACFCTGFVFCKIAHFQTAPFCRRANKIDIMIIAYY